MAACRDNGHQVTLLCKGKPGLAPTEENSGISIMRVFPPTPLGGTFMGRLVGFPAFFNPFWIRAVARFLRVVSPDVLLVRDLPLAYLVGTLGRLRRIPSILDMAENYPAALQAYKNPLYKPFLIGDSWLPRQYEKLSLRLLSHVFVVSDESRDRLMKQGLTLEKVTVVGNTPELESSHIHTCVDLFKNTKENSHELNLLFVGKIDAHRGVELVIKAVGILRQEFPSLTLTVVGDGTERARLEKLSRLSGLDRIISFPGWVEFRNIWGFIGRSAVCLIPHLRSEHTDTTLPNKLFDYMAMGKPVVMSDCIPLERIARESHCGLIFRSGDVDSLVQVLRRLLADSALRKTQGENGRKAVYEKYNWSIDRQAFLTTIDRFSTIPRNRPLELSTIAS